MQLNYLTEMMSTATSDAEKRKYKKEIGKVDKEQDQRLKQLFPLQEYRVIIDQIIKIPGLCHEFRQRHLDEFAKSRTVEVSH